VSPAPRPPSSPAGGPAGTFYRDQGKSDPYRSYAFRYLMARFADRSADSAAIKERAKEGTTWYYASTVAIVECLVREGGGEEGGLS